MMKKLILSLMLCCGCLTDDFENISITPNIKDTTSVLIVGVENSKSFNKCTGSLVDANNMKNLLSNFSKDVIVLTDEKATINNFTSALKNVITNELAIIYYSGHGGSYIFNDEMSKLEDDGQDEYLCLYNGGYRDDSIWNIISTSKGRVFLIFDCCHAKTMFKISTPKMFSTTQSDFKMLCWSGCPDDKSSYGANDGGKFTNTIRKYMKNGKSYKQLWNDCTNDRNLKSYQKIQQTIIGNFDVSKPAFN